MGSRDLQVVSADAERLAVKRRDDVEETWDRC